MPLDHDTPFVRESLEAMESVAIEQLATDSNLAASRTKPEPFLHVGGNTYVEHAGMTIHPELFQLITPRP